jgi:DNA gyrase subunit A
VSGIKPVGDDVVVGLALVSDDSRLLVASANGIGKRTPFADYRAQTRGGKGIITMKVTEKTGEVVGAIAVEESDELMLMTTGGQSIRIRVSEVRETGRNAQGVKLVSLRGGEKLQGIAKVLSGDVADEEESGEDEESEEGQEGAEAPSAPGDPESDSDASVDSSGEEE